MQKRLFLYKTKNRRSVGNRTKPAVYLLLARKDSNPDKQNQNLLCYRYTTGQDHFFTKAPQRYNACLKRANFF